MTSPIQLGKTYGVLNTEDYFSFIGFAKKVGSDETQKIDVFLDDKLIDTIEANEFIQKIDDMYDVENRAFTYNLPTQYIGKKAIISFKNHDSGEELLNSPYTLIDKNHEKFNEAKFLHSLSEPLSEELKNMYKPNCVGFLATKENLEDEEFIGYIKELMERFPDVEFKGFCFKKQDNKFINYIQINDIKDIILNSCVFIINPQLHGNQLDYKILEQQNKFVNIFVNDYNKLYNHLQIKNIVLPNLINVIKNNLEVFGLTVNDIEDISFNHILMVMKAFEKLSLINKIDEDTLLNTTLKELSFINIKDAINNKEFIKVQKYINKNLIELSK